MSTRALFATNRGSAAPGAAERHPRRRQTARPAAEASGALLELRRGGSAHVFVYRAGSDVWAAKVFGRRTFSGHPAPGAGRRYRRALAYEEAELHRLFARALGAAYPRAFVPLACPRVLAADWLSPDQADELELGGLPYLSLVFPAGGAPLSRSLAPRLAPPAPHFGRLFALLPRLRRRGLMHGDLKPDNLLFSREAGVRIVDLGIAACARRPFLGLLVAFLSQGTVYTAWPLDFFLAAGRTAGSLTAEESKFLADGALPGGRPHHGWDGSAASLEALRAALWRRYGRGPAGLPAFLSGIDVFMVGRLVLRFAGWGLCVSPALRALAEEMASFDPERRPDAATAEETFRCTPEGIWLSFCPAPFA